MLGDDVLLNLRRAAADDEAKIEHVAMLPDPAVPDVRAVVVEDADLAQRIDGQRRELVVQLAPLQLDDQAGEPGRLLLLRQGEQAKAVGLHGDDVRLQLHEPVEIERVIHKPLAVDRLGLEDVDDGLQPVQRRIGVP